jgi:hypothetical protein
LVYQIYAGHSLKMLIETIDFPIHLVNALTAFNYKNRKVYK